MRLCAKTHPVPCDPSQPAADANPEICYCKVKLFRDHGAERKLSNDVAHVKKSIDKLKQQIAQAESGLKDFGKRKRSRNVLFSVIGVCKLCTKISIFIESCGMNLRGFEIRLLRTIWMR